MSEKVDINLVKKNLFWQPQTNVYAVLDGASVPELPQVLWEHEPEHVCLYRGKLEPDMAEVAPYLAKLEYESPFTDWILEKGWGNHWGIFAVAPAALHMRKLRQHFRKFLMVLDPEGKRVYFRYYDPRVLRVYLPTCNAEELDTIFGPVTLFMLEDEDPTTMLKMSADDAGISVEKVALEKP